MLKIMVLVPLSFDPETMGSILPISACSLICILVGDVLAIAREKKAGQ